MTNTGGLDVDLDQVRDGDRLAADRADRVTLRRLSEHAYWVEAGGYQSTVVVRGSSALMLDPLSGGRGVLVRDAVREVLSADVTMIAYSHAHRDHCADVGAILATAPVPIVASSACAARSATLSGVAPPTRVLCDGDVLDFEGIAVEVRVVGGHSPDLTWFRLPDEGVLHLVDTLHPGQAEFDSFGMAVDTAEYRRVLQTAYDADWRVLTAGHGQLGWRGDVRLVLDYLDDLRSLVQVALVAHPIAGFAGGGHSYGRIAAQLAAVQEDVLASLTPRWGSLPGFGDVAHSHVKRMFLDLLYFT
jgi:glyoxylase-like metal-dependent hydrolase (beta-lactamase superfamily II)